MIKITGGQFKGRSIECISGRDIRPTSSKTRQGVFNVLFSMGFDIEGASVLEMFAGTGLISFESISRGALDAVLVDNSSQSLKVIENNVERLGIKDKVKLVHNDAMSFVSKSDVSGFDLIYLDPPYNYKGYEELLYVLLEKVNKDAVVIAESGRAMFNENGTENIKVVKIKEWGKSVAHFIRKR